MQERAALLDARLTEFRAGLNLTADQEKNWPTFENVSRSVAKSRAIVAGRCAPMKATESARH